MSFAFDRERSPRKGVAEQQQLLLQAWKCATADRSAVYISGPMNTGVRFFEWYVRAGRALKPNAEKYSEEHRKNVLIPNSLDIKATASRLRVCNQEFVLEPTSLEIPKWSQFDYVNLWGQVIDRFVHRVVMLPHWEFSIGCANEALRAIRADVSLTTPEGVPISSESVVYQLTLAAAKLDEADVPVPIRGIVAEVQKLVSKRTITVNVGITPKRKDEVLNELAEVANVAQFISYSPQQHGLRQEYSRILGHEANICFQDVHEAATKLLQSSRERSINLRSFIPGDLQSKPFFYGIRSVDEAVAKAKTLGDNGLHVILNETVDIRDGGVSGVISGDIIEFAPEDTPRAVEKPGITSLPRALGLQMLAIVYGFLPELSYPSTKRVEFSIHPERRGWKHTHTLCWELSDAEDARLRPTFAWPNRFSEFIGDKVFGLLVGHLIGLPVPVSTVISRKVAPFSFGRDTGTSEFWIRTSPRVQVPGKFTSALGWKDPFKLLHREDPHDEQIAAVLSQLTVSASYSGAAIVAADNQLVIEGVEGWGDKFMQGEVNPENLPAKVKKAVSEIFNRAQALLGAVRFEWVFDQDTGLAWVVQLHSGGTPTTKSELYPGSPQRWISFTTSDGLEALRDLLTKLEPNSGVLLKGEVGLTSHVADLIRRAEIPARFAN